MPRRSAMPPAATNCLQPKDALIVCLEDQVQRDSHVERNSRRFELQRGSKYLSIEGPAGVVDDEGSVGSLTHGGPLVKPCNPARSYTKVRRPRQRTSRGPGPAVSREALSRCAHPHAGLPALRD